MPPSQGQVAHLLFLHAGPVRQCLKLSWRENLFSDQEAVVGTESVGQSLIAFSVTVLSHRLALDHVTGEGHVQQRGKLKPWLAGHQRRKGGSRGDGGEKGTQQNNPPTRCMNSWVGLQAADAQICPSMTHHRLGKLRSKADHPPDPRRAHGFTSVIQTASQSL